MNPNIRALIISLSVCLLTAATGCVTQDSIESDDDEDALDESIAEGEQPLVPEDMQQCLVDCDGGGSGGGSTPPPSGTPPSSTDTSLSQLNASARTYLTQTGVSQSSTVGGVVWVNACKVSAQQGAGTFNSGITKSCVWANSLPGWIVIGLDYIVLENLNGRGSASVSSINGSATITTSEFGSKFNGAMSIAASLGDLSAQTSLQLEYQRLNGYSFNFNGTGNNVVATVTANGGLFKKSRIEIQARAKLLRVY